MFFQKQLLTIFLLHFTSQSVSAQSEVIVFHSLVNAKFIEAYKLAHSDQIFFSDSIKVNKNDSSPNLKKDFIEAQDHFLSALPGESIDLHWKRVTNYAFADNWGLNERKMIINAFFRLAQLSTNGIESEKWLKQAIEFDSQLEPESELYPPPLVEFYNAIKKRGGKILISTKNFSDFETILINGRKINGSAKSIQIWPGMKRLSLYSNKFKPISITLNATDISMFQPERDPLLLGSCEAPIFNGTNEILDSNSKPIGIFANGCSTKNGFLRKLSPMDLQPKILIQNNITSKMDMNKDFSRPIWRKPQFWIVTGLVASAVIYFKNKNANSEGPSGPPAKTQQTGF